MTPINCPACVDHAAALGGARVLEAASMGIDARTAARLSVASLIRLYLTQHHERERHADPPAAETGDPEQLRAALKRNRNRRHRRRLVYSRARQCDRKRRHASPEAARRAIRIMGKPDRHPYHCAHCGGWHVGTPPKRPPAGRRGLP